MERDISVDILKGIGILLMLFGHTAIPHEVSLWIYGFHMPLFFCASGFFAKDSGFWRSMQKNCKSILIPWLFMFFCYSTMNIAVSILHSGDVLGSLTALKGRYNLFDEDSLWYPTIWFLVCLFMLKTIDALIWCVTKRTDVRLVSGGGDLRPFTIRSIAVFHWYCHGNVPHLWNRSHIPHKGIAQEASTLDGSGGGNSSLFGFYTYRLTCCWHQAQWLSSLSSIDGITYDMGTIPD